MGLLTGFSILSGVEIIFYLFRSLCCSCNKGLKRFDLKKSLSISLKSFGIEKVLVFHIFQDRK